MSRKPSLHRHAFDTATVRANALLTSRWRLLAPDPLDWRELYSMLFTPQQHKAIELLSDQMPAALNTESYACVTFDVRAVYNVFDSPIQRKAKLMQVQFPEKVFVPETLAYTSNYHTFYISSLPVAAQEKLVDWAVRWLTLQSETDAVLSMIRTLLEPKNCTLGQAKRIWPNLSTLFTSKALAKLADAKMTSRYPAFVLDADGNLEWKYSPEQIQKYDDILGAALCMPEEVTPNRFTVSWEAER